MRYITVEEAAERMGIHQSRVRQLAAAGKVRFSSPVPMLIAEEDVDAFQRDPTRGRPKSNGKAQG
jgi:excisionase family DNA binding protein